MENKSSTKGLAIASMALGIFSIVGAQGGLVGIAAAVLAIIFAYKVKKAGQENQFSTVGRVTAFVGIALQIANTISAIIAVVGIIFWYFMFFLFIMLLSVLGGDAGVVYEFEDFVSNLSVIM